MMKTRQLKFYFSLLGALLVVLSFDLKAQDEFVPVDTTIRLNPADFIPADTGYFLMGVDKDLVGDDGIPEHYEGCYDAYGDVDHKEAGSQNGWYYKSVIIFSGCETDPDVRDDVIKGEPADPEGWPSVGNIIQITKHKYALTDSSTFGYIESPSFTNIKSLNVKVGTDLSTNGREIYMLVEASKDGGETWEFVDNDSEAFIHQLISTQGGDSFTYAGDSTGEGFTAIKTLSEAGPIKLRFLPFPSLPRTPEKANENGERLKIWEIIIEAQTAPVEEGGEPTLSNQTPIKTTPFVINNGFFESSNGESLFIYRLSGSLVGNGKSVKIPSDKGLFIVRTDSGFAQKIFIK